MTGSFGKWGAIVNTKYEFDDVLFSVIREYSGKRHTRRKTREKEREREQEKSLMSFAFVRRCSPIVFALVYSLAFFRWLIWLKSEFQCVFFCIFTLVCKLRLRLYASLQQQLNFFARPFSIRKMKNSLHWNRLICKRIFIHEA